MKKVLITIFIMLLLPLTVFASNKGLGFSIYKTKNTKIKMPLLITNIEKNSPAEKSNILKDNLIIKIEDKETNNLSLEECLIILKNSSKKGIKLEITDYDFQNNRSIVIKAKKGFKTEKDNIAINMNNFSQSYIFPILKNENTLEDLLFAYFETKKPNYKRSKYTNEEIDNIDKLKIEEGYQEFLKNKNNMEFNKYLYDGINSFINQYKEIIKLEINNVKNILIAYNKIESSASDKDILNILKTLNIKNSDYFTNYSINRREERINTWFKIAKEIHSYSINYEKNKKKQSKTNTPYFIDNIDFREVLWGWQNAKVPKKNGIYFISSQTGAYILQTVNNGLLVTSQHTALSVTPKVMFISSKREYADNDWIKDHLFMVFEGYYTYTTPMGISRKIYKFKEVPKEEYLNRTQTQKYYFID